MYAVGDGSCCCDAESSAYKGVCSALLAPHTAAEALSTNLQLLPSMLDATLPRLKEDV